MRFSGRRTNRDKRSSVMGELTIEDLRSALASHTRAGEVFPSVIRALAAQERWSGRLWDVLEVLAEDQETMRFAAGGDRPDEIADCAEQWAASGLDSDQLRLVLRSGGYVPEPFTALARAGLLTSALCDESGELRRIKGERAGTWVSDELALLTPETTIAAMRRVIAETAEAPGTPGGRLAYP
jgi:hypothetical protein